MLGRFPSAMSQLLRSQSDCRSNIHVASDTSVTHSGVYRCLSILKQTSRVNYMYQWVSLIAGSGYGMEQWNGKWNGTVIVHSDI